jgi:cell division protease FtsH
MSERLGHVALEKDRRTFLAGQDLLPPQERNYADETAAAVDTEVRTIVQAAMERTIRLLEERRDALERTARRLLEKETLDEAELAQLVRPAGSTCIGFAAE